MRIIIKDKNENKDINITIPSFAIDTLLSMAPIATKFVKYEKNYDIRKEDLTVFIKCAKEMNKAYKGLEIINIQEKNGNEIKIII